MLETPEQEESNLIDVKEFSKKFLAWTKKFADLILETEKKFAENKISWGSCVEEKAQQYPNNIAIKFEDTTLTYKEFNELVNQYLQPEFKRCKNPFNCKNWRNTGTSMGSTATIPC